MCFRLGAPQISSTFVELSARTRVASLTRRKDTSYIPLAWRFIPAAAMVAGLLGLAWRLSQPLSHRRLFVPIVLAVGAAAVVWLYERWIRDLTIGPMVSTRLDEGERCRRLVRRAFALEFVLVVVFLSAAHALLDVDWTTRALWASSVSLAAAIVGIAGCSVIVASDLARRRYTPIN